MALKTYVLTSMAKVFLDEEPKNDLQIKQMSAFQNEKAAFQLAYASDEFLYSFRLEIPENVKVYTVESSPAVIAAGDDIDDYYLRTKPGLYPDLLRPYTGQAVRMPKNIWRSFWFEVEGLPAGKHEFKLKLYGDNDTLLSEDTMIIDVLDAQLPKQDLICTNWFHCDGIMNYYHVPVFGDRFWEITENFIKTAVEHGINFILTPLFTPPLDTMVGCERPTVQLVDVTVTKNGYEFGFSNLRKWIAMCKRCGVEYYEMSHLFTQWGAQHAPKIMGMVNGEYKRIFGWETDSTGEEYKAFLSALAPELTRVLEDEGVADYTYFHVSDEPSGEALETYGKVSTLMHGLFGKRFKIFDALSEFEFYEKGYVSTPVPIESKIEDFVGKVPELWTYYCGGPTNEYYSNRVLSMPSQRTRVIGMQLYKYGVKGFLHWGYNYYYTCLSVRDVDPFAETDSGMAFPAGDGFVVYPGPDGTAWGSVRLKSMTEAFQDMRALQMLESKIGKEKVLEILEDNNGQKYNLSFTNYPRSQEWHFNKREEINRRIMQLL